MFGENLTTEGLSEESLFIGDQLKVGKAALTVTQPRVPCYKLGLRSLARVDAAFTSIPGAPHGFESWAFDTRLAQDFIAGAQDWLRRTLQHH